MKNLFCAFICLLTMISFFSACSEKEEQKSYAQMRREHIGKSSESSKNSENPSDDTNSKLIKVGFSQAGSESDWRVAHTNSIRDSLKKENGFDLKYENGNSEQKNQIQSIEGFIKDKVDVIILTPVVEDGWGDVLKKAKDAGIPVITTDRMIASTENDLFDCWVGSDFVKEGQNSIEWLKEYASKNLSSQNHKIVVLQGTLGSSAQKGRTEGIHNSLKGLNNFEIVFEETGNFNEIDGEETMKKAINSVGDFDVLIAQNDDMALGAIKALKDNSKNPGSDITVISFDGTKRAFQSIISGDMNVTVECNPLHGPKIAQIIKDITSGKNVEKIQYVSESIYAADTAAAEIEKRLY